VQLIRQAADLRSGGRKVCVAIGVFDGVHLGHQQVIKQTISDARTHNGIALALTFDRHPGTVVAPAKAPPLIYSLPQKLREIQALAVDATLLIEFTREFSQQSGEQFVRHLAGDLRRLTSVSVGSTFTFGHKKSGNVELLKQLGAELGFQVHGLAAVSLDGRIVSSTRIREQIAAGDLNAASQMLGRAYSVAGRVLRGDQLGRKLGFPTANIDIAGLLMPPNGVYAVIAKRNGTSLRGVANIGVRPTVSGTAERRFEVHLFSFSEEIYDAELEVIFAGFIRTEQRFASLEELKAQIARDVLAAQKILE
jgi:riboflavin kinase / FMN adenylyltransferase